VVNRAKAGLLKQTEIFAMLRTLPKAARTNGHALLRTKAPKRP
jgi:hypothetical protein